MRGMKHILKICLFIYVLYIADIMVSAKELEVCRLCNGSKDYHCSGCNNVGEVVCDGCYGAGGSVCPGDSYMGNSCDKGYYICASCNGDGKMRTGDGEIVEGLCGNCNGAGKHRCIVCSNGTPGWNECTRCVGDGMAECQRCIAARKIGYKCPKCTGTGFCLLENPMPPDEYNDGVRNVPNKGDHIIVDEEWHYYIYGEDPGVILPEKPETPKEPGTSTVEPGQTDTEETTNPNQNEQNGDGIDNENKVTPDDRNSNYDIPSVSADGTAVNSSAIIDISKMTNEEQLYYASLDEEELNRKLVNIQQILASVKPGTYGENSEELIKNIAKKNGINSLEEGRIVPLYFEGHEDLGFPIEVSVRMEKGMLDGGTRLYVYHICNDGKIELLGDAEYSTYDDGSVENISFYTTGFSSFFTSARELEIVEADVSDDLDGVKVEENDTRKDEEKKEGNGTKHFVWIVTLAVVVIFFVFKGIERIMD